jgi:hypothetical protein
MIYNQDQNSIWNKGGIHMKRAIIILSSLLLISIAINLHQYRIVQTESKWCEMYWDEVEKSLSLEWELESIKTYPYQYDYEKNIN